MRHSETRRLVTLLGRPIRAWQQMTNTERPGATCKTFLKIEKQNFKGFIGVFMKEKSHVTRSVWN